MSSFYSRGRWSPRWGRAGTLYSAFSACLPMHLPLQVQQPPGHSESTWGVYNSSLFCSGDGAGIQSWVPLRVSSSPQELALKLRGFRLARQQGPDIKTGDRHYDSALQTATLWELVMWPEKSERGRGQTEELTSQAWRAVGRLQAEKQLRPRASPETHIHPCKDFLD